jgi:hypothetical protein
LQPALLLLPVGGGCLARIRQSAWIIFWLAAEAAAADIGTTAAAVVEEVELL